MMISAELLSLLRCPLSGQPLRLASAEELFRLPSTLAGALIREDDTIAYPIRDGIPVVLADEAIPLDSTPR